METPASKQLSPPAMAQSSPSTSAASSVQSDKKPRPLFRSLSTSTVIDHVLCINAVNERLEIASSCPLHYCGGLAFGRGHWLSFRNSDLMWSLSNKSRYSSDQLLTALVYEVVALRQAAQLHDFQLRSFLQPKDSASLDSSFSHPFDLLFHRSDANIPQPALMSDIRVGLTLSSWSSPLAQLPLSLPRLRKILRPMDALLPTPNYKGRWPFS